jgi:hypothetical protein
MKLFLFSLSFLTLVLLDGCHTPGQITPQSIGTSYQTSMPSQTSTRTSIGTPTPFPVPTLTSLQQAQMFELINNDACDLPCYFGITSGKTTWQEAKEILAGAGATLRWDFDSYEDGLIRQVYEIRINNGEKTLYQDIVLTIGDNKVQRLAANTFSNFLDIFYINWSRYSIRRIFTKLGLPDKVFVFTRTDPSVYSLLVGYEKLGVVIEWNGIQQDEANDLICPAFSKDDTVGLDLRLTNLSSSLSLYQSDISPYVHDFWRPIKDELGLTEKEFYTLIISDQSVCFRTK